MIRAALGRPVLSCAAALALISASASAVAAATGHDPTRVLALPAAIEITAPVDDPVDVAALIEQRRVSGQRSVAFQQQQLVAQRQANVARAARDARRRALTSADPKVVARALLATFGWSTSQFSCLDSLWTRESKWSISATNPTSGAYGIPQALPGSKMSSAGPDWRTDPLTQITWGLGYIRTRYGSPCSAWGHSEAHGWY